MIYAVVKSGGKQYQISIGQELLVDKLKVAKGESYIFPEVLMIRNDETVHIGNPYVSNAKVTGKVLDVMKGEKITISKFKAKVHYRRKMGFRPIYSKVKIEAISMDVKGVKSQDKKTSPKIKRA